MSFHKVVLKLHLWTGLASAIFLLVLGVTGSILEWAPEAPMPGAIQPQGHPLPMSQILESLQKAAPGVRFQGVSLGTRPSQPYRFHAAREGGGKRGQRARRTTYIVNQYTGEVQQAQGPAMSNAFMGAVESLHTNLWLGKSGTVIVTYSTLVGIFLILTGIILWWPRKIWGVRKGSSWRRFNFDLHSIVGIYSMVFFFIIALTGVMIHWGQIGKWIVRTAGQEAPQRAPIHSASPAADAQPLSLEQVLATADALPGNRTTQVNLAEPPADTVSVSRTRSNDEFQSQIMFRLDRYSGAVLAVDDPATRPWALRLQSSVVDIHEGTLFGWTGRIIACVTSTAIPVMVITGFIIWWKRKLTEWRRQWAARGGGSLTPEQLEDELEDRREDLDRQPPTPRPAEVS